MEKLTPDINPLFNRMKPVLRNMEQIREEVVSKFRPLLMVFAVYAMFCFLMPYLDFGVPRHFRGNLFYFLLTIGLLSFSVVIAIYYRACREMQQLLDHRFYHGLSRYIREETIYMKEVNDHDAYLPLAMWGQPYNFFQARNLIQGTFDGKGFTWVQATVQQRFMESIRTDRSLFHGLVLRFELNQTHHFNGMIIGRSHLSYHDEVREGRELMAPGKTEQAARYVWISGDEEMPGDNFVQALWELDEQLRLQRVIRKDLILVIQQEVLILAIPVYDRLWELVNWKPFETSQFLSRQLLPFNGLLKLAQSLNH